MSEYLVSYSAVVDGQGNPFGTAADHERDVKRILQTLMASQTGRAVFRKIVAHGIVRIIPYVASKRPTAGVCNAVAPSERHSEKISSGLSRQAVNIEFSPGTWTSTGGCHHGPGFHPDEILLHEMVHSARELGGEFNQIPLTGDMARYQDEEEYFAVLVANIYISEKGRQPISWLVGSGQSGLRLTYKKADVSDDQALSVDFLMFGENFRLVKKFCKQHTTIARLLGEVSARFNPIKVFYRWQKMGIEPQGGALTRSH